MNDSHEERMKRISRVALPPRWTPGYEALVEYFERQRQKNPKLRKQLKKHWQKAQAIYHTTMLNGAGLLADQVIREFFNSFNTRLINAGLHNLPASFNILEAFVRYLPYLNLFELLLEKDHCISIEDFLDFVTSRDAPDDPYSVAYMLDEDTVYNYTISDDPHGLLMSTEDGSEFGIGAFSIVRRGDEIVVLVTAGEATDFKQAVESFEHPEDEAWRRRRFLLDPTGDQLKHEATPLEGTSDLLRTFAMTRLNLKRRTTDVRYLYYDFGDGYTGYSDDPVIVLQLEKSHEEEEFIDKMKQQSDRLDNKQTLFEIAKTAILLLAYFEFKITLIRTEKHETELGKKTKGESFKIKRITEEAPTRDKVIFRKISALHIVGSRVSSPIGRSYTPPQFQVEVSGFWRRLYNPESMGRDAEGKEIKGRTWVKNTFVGRISTGKKTRLFILNPEYRRLSE